MHVSKGRAKSNHHKGHEGHTKEKPSFWMADGPSYTPERAGRFAITTNLFLSSPS
jgi:hypothetical protein